MNMNEIRGQIDTLDDEIRAAFLERMALSAKIAAYKQENGLPIHCPAREEEILSRLSAGLDAEMATYIKVLYDTLFCVSRAYQANCIADGTKG